MKKIISFLSAMLICLQAIAQHQVEAIQTDSIISVINNRLYHIETALSQKERYKLYSTENIYTLLKLDTKTGRVEQIQWNLDDDKEFTVPISLEDLSLTDNSAFELYPTKNMYQFILLDKTYGRTWRVQWGDRTQRYIKTIY